MMDTTANTVQCTHIGYCTLQYQLERLNFQFRLRTSYHYNNYKIQKHFQNVMLVGMASEISKTTHTSVWIAQDTTESRVPRLCVHTNQILVHTFSHCYQ